MRAPVLRASSDSLYGHSSALRCGFADALCPRCPSSEPEPGVNLPTRILPAATRIPFDRSDDVNAIHTCLEGRRNSAYHQPRTCIINGMGGVGKSALARQYVEEHRNEFDIVCWIPSDTHHSIFGCYRDLGRQLRIPGHETLGIQNEDVQRVADWLSKCGKQPLLQRCL